MTRLFFKIFISQLLLSNAVLFGMLMPVDPHFKIATNYYKNSVNQIKKQHKPMLLIEAAPLDYGVRNAHLPKDVLLEIGERYDIKNELKNTCRFMHKLFSKTKPNMYRLALNRAYLSKKDTNFIILNAACDKRTHVMLHILNNTEERQFYYDVFMQYNSNKSSGKRLVAFDLPEICEINKMGNSGDISVFPLSIKDINGNVFQYDLKKAKHRTSSKIVPLMVAVAFGGTEDIINALASEVDDVSGLLMVFGIAIEQNNLDCIRALSLKVKEMKQNGRALSSMHYDALLMTAMIGNKKETFEMLVEEDPFGCLNYCQSHRSTLDRLLMVKNYIANQDEYTNIYKKHGGKHCSEIIREGIQKEEKEREEARKKMETATEYSFWGWF
jgi:hypothetical protein